MSDRKLNLVFLVVTVVYSVVTLVTSSVIIAAVQERSRVTAGEIAVIQRMLEANQTAFDKTRSEIRDGIFLLSNSMTMGIIGLQNSNTRESLQSIQQALAMNTTTAAGFWARGLGGVYELARTRSEVASRANEIEALIARTQSGEVDPAEVLLTAEFLGGQYIKGVEQAAIRRDEMRRDKERLDQRESLIKNIALALQFMMILAVFAKDYYRERRKAVQGGELATPRPPSAPPAV